MYFVDVILPVPLEGLFTYGVPEQWVGRVAMGVRVLVPLGKSKHYIAMAVKVHREEPEMKWKSIEQVLDDKPVVSERQMRLWQWISDYYMSPIGDVFKAAMPGGMKTEEGYRPRTETFLDLPVKWQSEQNLHLALDMMRRAEKQRRVFEAFLEMTGWDKMQGDVPQGVITELSRDELMNATHCTAATLKSLTDKGFLVKYEREVGRLNHQTQPDYTRIRKLNAAQQDAYNDILMGFLKKNVVLLHGVTSSGKTELYIHLIKRAIDRHEQVLYLMPEIALTVQMQQRLQRVFGSRLGIYHSKYSDAERVEIWQKQLSETPYDVVLGARSAVFLPFQRLGLVIVDEEHETSFKQQDPAPRYHARSAAIVLAAMYGAKTLLGTATPSAESYHNVITGKYALATLSTRYKDIAMPEIRVVDTKDLHRRKMMRGAFSPQLLAAMRSALDNGEQVILFQNRRGFAPMVECRVCGWVPKCRNCDVSLTLHKNTSQLTCHYCGFTYGVPERCPNCDSNDLRGRGFGTEKVEDMIMELFTDARVARMDLDTTRTRSAYERIIADFSAGTTNILIGTQMVTKGLDFDRVSVVGILNADSMLNFPDFRAYEHAFMMMSQVSGRAGRRGRQGLVILQTKNKDLPIVRQVVENDFVSYFKDLEQERRDFRYPPFTHLIYVYMKHRDERLTESAAMEMGARLRQGLGTRVLGPDKPAVAKVKTMNIRKIVLKLEIGIDLAQVRRYLRQTEREMMRNKQYNSLQVYFDIDPL
ncbi:MAG: primosomal protein N' [Prevotella sp.]|uniref:replication restart helicase PriA n=1 Tax=Prevotella sp. TaxID=59823 RepID=UPI002A2BAF9B|nr:primosomal protein N' [Prevotella sp.]MDD7317950.1 primosomal protein N' [Prevotellaceae bacterium]MDY4020841.1 primosomal protein N' [Prevotella sp.]